MAIDSAAFAAMVTANVAKFGVSVTFRRKTGSTFNTTTGKPAETFSDRTVTMQRNPTARDFKGPVQAKEDRRSYLVLASALAAVPQQDDRVTDGGESWKVLGVKRRASNLAYELECAKVAE